MGGGRRRRHEKSLGNGQFLNAIASSIIGVP